MVARGRFAGERTAEKAIPLGRVLIVEDNGLLALDMQEAFNAAGATETTVCAAIADAMGAFGAQPPDIIVLDVMLADRDDGWALAELAVELDAEPPLIIFSTGAPERIPARIRELGHVLAKPFEMDALVHLARTERGKRRGLFSRLRSR